MASESLRRYSLRVIAAVLLYGAAIFLGHAATTSDETIRHMGGLVGVCLLALGITAIGESGRA